MARASSNREMIKSLVSWLLGGSLYVPLSKASSLVLSILEVMGPLADAADRIIPSKDGLAMECNETEDWCPSRVLARWVEILLELLLFVASGILPWGEWGKRASNECKIKKNQDDEFFVASDFLGEQVRSLPMTWPFKVRRLPSFIQMTYPRAMIESLPKKQSESLQLR